MRLIPVLFAFAVLPAWAASPAPAAPPEIQRAVGSAQAIGVDHSLRTIPEACARLQGVFTGQAADPYEFSVVRTSPNCQPRARFVAAVQANPSEASGWKFNDLIRVPSAACPSQHAVVRVWRKPVATAAPELDAQGRARVYLQDAKQAAAAGNPAAAVTMFTASMTVEGEACGG